MQPHLLEKVWPIQLRKMTMRIAVPSPLSLHVSSSCRVLNLVACSYRSNNHVALAAVAAAAALPGKCTYNDSTSGTSSWLDQELPNLLSMQSGKPASGLVLKRGSWSWNVEELTHYQLRGVMDFCNVTRRNEVFVNEVTGQVVLLSDEPVDRLIKSVQVRSKHPGGKPANRKDGYWPAYIIRAQESTQIEVIIDIQSVTEEDLTKLQAVRLEIRFVAYGPHGRSVELQHVILPLQFPEVPQNASWQRFGDNGAVLPVRTHLLCHMDDPLLVLQRYVLSHAKAGDIIAIGETPLAIMQGRFRHPYNIKPCVLAKIACRVFHPTSSLATACGMQALLDIAGKLRVLLAFIIAVLTRLGGVRGMFYRLAGEQARLIDDVSGTLPPYDQFITLGPVQAQATVDFLQQRTGFGIAVVDVNNLKRVHILAASDKVNQAYLKKALLSNPAGNEDEQTPIVVLRPP